MTTSPAGPIGLTSEEARRRLAIHGPNEIRDRERRGLGRILAGIATEPMFGLLLLAAVVYLALGDLAEGMLLAAFAALTVGLVVLQERRSERALDALRELATPQARVWRDGRLVRLPARDLVPGDLFVVCEGERVAADGLLREATGLGVDESLLTGESVPVRKRAADGRGTTPQSAEPAVPGGDDLPQVYAGTLAIGGHGLAEVTATGGSSRVGRIGASLAHIDPAPTPLQRHLGRLVRVFGAGAAVAAVLLLVWMGLARGDWLEALLAAIAFGMAMLPEEFPMALAVFLALGARRLARVQVLARRPAVVEALGGTTMLCVDKTGTLTENRMRLVRLVTAEADVTVRAGEPWPEAVHRLAETAMLASRPGGADPMDLAVLGQGGQTLAGTEHLHPHWHLEREWPLTPDLPAMTHAWIAEDGHRRVAAKGAPEAVLGLCHLDIAVAQPWLDRVAAMAAQGLRVLAVAEGRDPDGGIAVNAHDHEFRLLGLLGFEDPLRASVPAAVAQARGAGIAVAMITGDHAATALAIAARAGLDTSAGALTGDALARMDDPALADAVRRVRVFARISPEQKLRLVQAFQRDGETVAMTGDGVNDAPALKAAHIGIAMGRRGTDVAREAAGIVLLDEDFGHIVAGVRLGRRIADNLRRVMTYITAIHVPIAGLSLLPVVFGLPPLMLPAHVVLTEMVIDPVCSLAFEGAPEEPDTMRRPPRRGDAGIVGRPMLVLGLVQGACLLAATLAVYLIALQGGRNVEEARTLAVVGLTAGNLALVALNVAAGGGWRRLMDRSVASFWAIAVVAAGVMLLCVGWEPARSLLRFAVPAPSDMAAALGAVAVAIAVATAATRLLRAPQAPT